MEKSQGFINLIKDLIEEKKIKFKVNLTKNKRFKDQGSKYKLR